MSSIRVRALSSAFVATVVLIGGLLDAASTHAAIPNFGQVAPGIFRGAQPEGIADLRDLRARGVRTVLNLRADGTVAAEERDARELGLTFISAPIRAGFYPPEDVVQRAVAAISDPRLYPIFVHCQAGEARTGLIVGLFRTHVQGWTRDAAYREMKDYGFNRWHFALYRYFMEHTRADERAPINP